MRPLLARLRLHLAVLADGTKHTVTYPASDKPSELVFAATYNLWIPEGVKQVRGIIVHQHGCGEGSNKGALTAADDLHWQALARKHECALLAPAYEQPDKADCQQWCDPRNGSSAAFQRGLADPAARGEDHELVEQHDPFGEVVFEIEGLQVFGVVVIEPGVPAAVDVRVALDLEPFGHPPGVDEIHPRQHLVAADVRTARRHPHLRKDGHLREDARLIG
ncbi:MAG: hypothetical protein ACKOBS_07610, partial [Verrucomicrobiota bacterium]